MAPVAREQAPRAAIVAGWPSIPADAKFGQVSAVDVDAQGRVYVLQRGSRAWTEPFPKQPIAEPTVYVFDGSSGKLLDRWGAGIFTMPHGLSVDPQGKVWITDAGREQVFRFSADGKLELTIGTQGVTGDDATHLGRPTDIAFQGNHVLVADGYLNGRIAVFDREGRFQTQFGCKGAGEGCMNIPHSIAVDRRHYLVADRENGRIDLFDFSALFDTSRQTPEGGFPYAVKPLGNGRAVSVEGRDKEGHQGAILRFWRADGSVERVLNATAREGPSRGHDLAVGPDGMIYVADVEAGRVIKIDPNGKGR